MTKRPQIVYYVTLISLLFAELNLEKVINYQTFASIASKLEIDIDFDEMFNELSILNEIIRCLSPDDKKLDNDKLWSKILKTKIAETYSFPNIIKIMETVLSIPISNDTVERVFSLMKRIWNERNSMNTDMVKAEICINFNFSMTCSEFAETIVNNTELLKAAKSDNKYSFKNKTKQ